MKSTKNAKILLNSQEIPMKYSLVSSYRNLNQEMYIYIYRGADKSLARPTYRLIVFSVQGTGGSPTGPDTEKRVGNKDIGSPGRPVSSGLQVPGEPFPSCSG
jgi:hypothetical protein